MKLGLPDRKKLWGRAAGRCSMPDCRRELFLPEENDVNLGKEAHICSKRENGPRYSLELVDSGKTETYENAILLCSIHHDVIDQNPNKWTVNKLKRTKEEHEEWVRERPELEERIRELEKKIAKYAEKVSWVMNKIDKGRQKRDWDTIDNAFSSSTFSDTKINEK